jgi:hypothetical protein
MEGRSSRVAGWPSARSATPAMTPTLSSPARPACATGAPPPVCMSVCLSCSLFLGGCLGFPLHAPVLSSRSLRQWLQPRCAGAICADRARGARGLSDR